MNLFIAFSGDAIKEVEGGYEVRRIYFGEDRGLIKKVNNFEELRKVITTRNLYDKKTDFKERTLLDKKIDVISDYYNFPTGYYMNGEMCPYEVGELDYMNDWLNEVHEEGNYNKEFVDSKLKELGIKVRQEEKLNIVVGENNTLNRQYINNENTLKSAVDIYPESEKHPKNIRKYVDDCIRNRDDHRYIVTHSETIVNYLGTLVSDGVLCSEGVKVTMVGSEGRKKDFYYNEDGILEKWPMGFFY